MNMKMGFKTIAATIAALLLLTAITAGCGGSTLRQQDVGSRDDTQGGKGNKLHKGDLHSK